MTISLLIDTSGGSNFENYHLRNVASLHVGGAALAAETLDVTGTVGVSDTIKVDKINEFTAAAGVTIDGVIIKDSGATFAGDIVQGNGFGVIIGHTALLAVAETTSELQVLGTAAADGSITIGRYSADINPAALRFYKSRAAIGSLATVVTGDELGAIRAYGDDGTDANTRSSAIIFDTEGTISTGQVPGIIRIQVAAAGTLADAITINSNKDVAFAGTGPHAIGGATLNYAQTRFTGAFTSGGASTFASGIYYDTTLTGLSGDTVGLSMLNLAGTITTQANDTVVTVATLRLDEPNITVGASGTVTNSTVLYISGVADEGTNNYALWVDAGTSRFDGLVGIGTTSPNSNFELHVNDSAGVGSVLIEGSNIAQLVLNDGTGGSDLKVWIIRDDAPLLHIGTQTDAYGSFSAKVTIDRGGVLFIGDTANANMAIGLTINQAGNDNQAFCLKSSDVATVLTTATLVGDVETDDFFTIQKAAAAFGGVVMNILAEDANINPFIVDVYGGQAATSDTTASIGLINLRAGEHDGANAMIATPANANLLTVQSHDNTGAVTRLLLKADDGELHLGNTTLVALDDYIDEHLVLAMRRESSTGVKGNPWGGPVYDYDVLHKIGVLGEKDEKGNCLFAVQPRFAMNEGAIWQAYLDRQELRSEVADLRDLLATTRKQLALLN